MCCVLITSREEVAYLVLIGSNIAFAAVRSTRQLGIYRGHCPGIPFHVLTQWLYHFAINFLFLQWDFERRIQTDVWYGV